jgi:hypothetical protein
MELERLVPLVLMAGVLLSACSGEPSGLPTASAYLHWATVDLPRGGYCWFTAGQGTCADTPGPDVLLRNGYLKPYRTAGGYRAQVVFHSSSAHTSSKIEMIMSPSGRRSAVTEPAPLAFDLPVIPSQGPGVYVYLVTGTWKEGTIGFFLVLDEIPGGA